MDREAYGALRAPREHRVSTPEYLDRVVRVDERTGASLRVVAVLELRRDALAVRCAATGCSRVL